MKELVLKNTEMLSDLLVIVKDIQNNAVNKTEFQEFRDSVDNRFDAVDNRFDEVNDRFLSLEHKLEDVQEELTMEIRAVRKQSIEDTEVNAREIQKLKALHRIV